jgi:hypothetical protein
LIALFILPPYNICKVNKKVIIGIIVLAVFLIGGYMVFAKKNPSSPTASPVATEQPQAPTSLRDLIAQGISQSCTYSTDKSNGMIYLAGGKIRGDFNVGTSVSHMIIMDSTNYLWTEGSKTGIKMAFDQNATPAPVTSNTPTNSFDANALNNYKCSPWVADNTMFTLPAGVSFMAVANPVSSGASNSSLCAKCDALSGDNKTQCMAALNCK